MCVCVSGFNRVPNELLNDVSNDCSALYICVCVCVCVCGGGGGGTCRLIQVAHY